MKHSQALRKGMEIHPAEVNYSYVAVDDAGRILGTCAVVAIYEGRMGALESYQDFAKVHDSGVLWIKSEPIRCVDCVEDEVPDDFLTRRELDAQLMHLTDRHGYSRERCAQWLEERGW